MVEELKTEYYFSGTLPGNYSTYVTRSADNELLDALQKGKFCYVLNSRQSGKSSLRLRTMNRLSSAGIECASIDLSAIDIQSATQEKWYADLIVKLIDSFDLDINFKEWWSENQLNSSLLQFGNFLEKKLLAEVKQSIVIFIDEIDSVLSLKFPTDDFFAFIRSCYNQRVDNPELLRLTFCLLGVASPSNLIEDKQRTPFNIGKSISLSGFQIHEVEPLKRGLQGKFRDSQAVMQEILDWTGGQPFLTQKLCQFIVEESEKENPRTVEQVVRSRIIENWESQDVPEHLRTIRDRILRDEQRAGYLLELYQMVRLAEEQSELLADDTLEQSELQLSGLVVREHNKLRVYNLIYQEIFDDNWIESQLKNLRPYSENFRVWVASGRTDESRLLRGKALQEAEEWAKDKNLSYQDKQYLAASKEKEIQSEIVTKEQEAALERERKDKEATETRNQVLSEANQALAEANQKARQRIIFGFVVLVLTVVGAVTVVVLSQQRIEVANQELKQAKRKTKEAQKSEQDAKHHAYKALKQANASKRKNEETKQEVEAVKQLNKLAGELENQKSSNSDYNEALRLSALSFNIDNHSLKQALVFAAQSLANQQLYNVESQAYQKPNRPKDADKKLKKAEQEIDKSKTNLDAAEADKKRLDFKDYQIQVLFYKIQGSLLAQKKQNHKAIEAYKTAFKILKEHSNETDFTKDNQFVTGANIESVHRTLIDLLPKNNTELELREQVEKSLTNHLYAQLGYFLKAKNWQEADTQTYRLMLNIAKREKETHLDYDSINSFSCPDMKRIDQLWIQSDKRFGFSVQKEIWIKTGNRLGIKIEQWNKTDEKSYRLFSYEVGWYDHNVRENETGDSRGEFVSYDELMEGIKPVNLYLTDGRTDGGWSLPWDGMGSLPITYGMRYSMGSLPITRYWQGAESSGLGSEYFFSRVATCEL